MKKLNPVGFTAVATILLIVILAAIGGVGYYVYHANQQADDDLKASASAAQTAPTAKAIEGSTTGWVTASSPAGGFSLKHPKEWVEPAHKDLCSPEILARSIYLGPDANSVLKCATENFGEISVVSVAGDKQLDYDLSEDPGFNTVTNTAVTVDGVTGKRIAATAGQDPGGEGDFSKQASLSGSYRVGTKTVTYIFYANGNTYAASYVQNPEGTGSRDVLADFDLMITKTLKFS